MYSQLIILTALILSVITGCQSDQANSSADQLPNINKEIIGSYKAAIITDSPDADIQTMSKSATIKFTFNEDNTAIYEAKIMNNDIHATGKYSISQDSLFLYELGSIPDGHFKVKKLEGGQWQLNGSGHFLLTPIP